LIGWLVGDASLGFYCLALPDRAFGPLALTASQQFGLGAVVLFLAVLLAVAEALGRRVPGDTEISRKIVHVGAGHVVLLAWWFEIPAWMTVLAGAIAAVIALLSYAIPFLPSINSVGRKSLGTFFYAVSIGVLAGSLWSRGPEYVAIGVLVMAWGDGLAALVGQQFGKHPYRVFGSTKSWEGSLAMAAASYAVASTVLLSVQGSIWPTWVVPLAIAAVATALEAVSQLGIDNLTVPVASAVLSFALNQLALSS